MARVMQFDPGRYSQWLHDEILLPVVFVLGTEVSASQVRKTNSLSLVEVGSNIF